MGLQDLIKGDRGADARGDRSDKEGEDKGPLFPISLEGADTEEALTVFNKVDGDSDECDECSCPPSESKGEDGHEGEDDECPKDKG